MSLYPDQLELKTNVMNAWDDYQNVLMVLPCGGGKTRIFTSIIQDESAASVVLTHRAELVLQISLALAHWEVSHRIIGPKHLINACIEQHIVEVGRNYVNPSARCGVASVNTLIGLPPTDSWFRNVRLWVTDEAHHSTRGGMWEKCINLFPKARGLGVTATPKRSDGKGLGRHADGFFDTLVIGKTMRELIAMGRLCDYRLFSPPSDLDISQVPVGASGDFQSQPLRRAVQRSHLVGDIVQHYLNYAPGLRAIVFTVDIESAEDQAAAFRRMGIPAKAVSGKTDPVTRRQAIRDITEGRLLILCNCDVFGEGTDLPAVECVIFGRPSQSEGLVEQQFGRALRLSPGKTHGIIIDPVRNIRIDYGNVALGRHPLPDAVKTHSLDRQEKRSRSDTVPSMVRTCLECLAVYDKVKHGMICPYCKTAHVPAQRSGPEFVDGDLGEVDPAVLERSRRAIDAALKPPHIPHGASRVVVNSIMKNHREHIAALSELHDAMLYDARNVVNPSEYQRAFYLKHGIDVLTARALGKKEAVKLKERLMK